MSLLRSFSQGSFFSDQTLLRIREGYRPMSSTSDADTAFKHWTLRATTQHEASVAREMAGLSEERLAELTSEFERVPRRLRSDKLRLAFPAGSALLLFAAVALVLDASVLASASAGMTLLQGLAIGGLSGGVLALGIAAIAAFSMMPLDVAHGQVGLSCGLLDEQHPWLYKAAILQRNQAADAYRRRVLSERGPLRGLDYLMMREIARVSDALEMTRVARSLAEQLNEVDATTLAAPHAAAPSSPLKEPRLVSVPTHCAESAEVPGRGTDSAASHAALGRVFASTATDRRRPA